jgi:hypothetical protein
MAIDATSVNIQTLSRGPTIVILSLITLILPHFLYLSVATLILLSSAFVGLLITITDLTTLLHSHYNQLRITIKRYGDDLIIDDVLKDLFGPEGWLSFAVGSWIGTVFLYFLPLSKELRWRIIRHILLIVLRYL